MRPHSTATSTTPVYDALPMASLRAVDASAALLHPEMEDTEEDLEVEVAPNTVASLHRNLSERHLTMIAIGGIIGPGLLVGSGNALATAGPVGALLAFISTGVIVFFVMQSLGEMTTYAPVTGSFITYAERYIDPAVAFGLDESFSSSVINISQFKTDMMIFGIARWIYWVLWISVLCNEYNNVSILLWYWPFGQLLPQWTWIVLFWCIITGFGFLGVRAYGEAEYWLTLMKVVAIAVFFLISLAIDLGGAGNPPSFIGLKYFRNPGPFADSFRGVAKIFVVSGTLYAGCESVGVVAGESRDPSKAVPKAIRTVFLRILFFYIGTILFIGLLIPYNSDRLLSATSKTAASPFTIVLEQAGIRGGASVMNTVIIITVISAGNSALYLSSRILLTLSLSSHAPSWLSLTNDAGVPYRALLFSNFVCLFVVLLKSIGGTTSGKMFGYLMSVSGVSTFVCWGFIAASHIRFRRAMEVQGKDVEMELGFKAWGYPYGAYFALFANCFLILFQGFTTLSPFSFIDFIVAYLIVPIFVGLVSYWKRKHRTRIVALEDVDLDFDRM